METQRRDLTAENPNELRELLDKALVYGTMADLEGLLDDGMDVNQEDWQGRTALMMCAAKGKIGAVEMLLRRKADINRIYMYQDRMPKTALDAANESGKVEIANLLKEHGAKTGKEVSSP